MIGLVGLCYDRSGGPVLQRVSTVPSYKCQSDFGSDIVLLPFCPSFGHIHVLYLVVFDYYCTI